MGLQISLLAIVCASLALPARADILRRCDALIYTFQNGEWATLATLVGQGPCKNRANADKCRERARAELDECLDIIWDDHRFDGTLPEQCRDMAGNRRGARMEWEGIRLYPAPRSLFREAIHEICCLQEPDKSMMTFDLGGMITGGPGCASSIGNNSTQSDFSFVTNFIVDCNHWRTNQGICDRP